LQQEIDNFAARDQEQKTENAKLLAEIEVKHDGTLTSIYYPLVRDKYDWFSRT